MTYLKRARSTGQKQFRINQITKAADELFENLEYKDITMEMIASKLDFSRANIARYVTNKEEIFMLLFIEDFKHFAEDIEKACGKRGKMSIKIFSQMIAETAFKHKNFLKIGSILYTVIEINIKPEILAEYKREIFAHKSKIAAVIQEQFDFVQADETHDLLSLLFNHISGLYPITELSQSRRRAVEISEVRGGRYLSKGFIESGAYFIEIIINGYKSMGKREK